jgi:hypothetical protein
VASKKGMDPAYSKLLFRRGIALAAATSPLV